MYDLKRRKSNLYKWHFHKSIWWPILSQLSTFYPDIFLIFFFYFGLTFPPSHICLSSTHFFNIELFAEEENKVHKLIDFHLFPIFSSVILMCTLAVATAPPPPSSGSSASVPRSLATPRKYRDSKISRIQPYNNVHSETLTAPAIDSYNNLHSEKDSAIKYYHANKFLEKTAHGHKKFGFDKKKVSSNHELFKWVNNTFFDSNFGFA